MRAVAFSMFLTVALLAACERGTPAAQGASSAPAATSAKRGKTVSADLTGYNHTDKTIAAFYVDGQWGGNVFPGTGGGSFVCCISLPAPWREGTKVTVSWEDHELKTHSREVLVPRYDDRGGGMTVHFLRDGQIKVFVGMTFLGHPDYPLKGKESELKPGVPIDIHN
jgi:Protein of unknown function (DUF3304)